MRRLLLVSSLFMLAFQACIDGPKKQEVIKQTSEESEVDNQPQRSEVKSASISEKSQPKQSKLDSIANNAGALNEPETTGEVVEEPKHGAPEQQSIEDMKAAKAKKKK